MSFHVACLAPDCSFLASKELALMHFLTTHSAQSMAPASPNPSVPCVAAKPTTVAEPWQRGCVLPPTSQPSAVSSAAYTCKLCKVSGHWIYDCTQFVKHGDAAKQPVVAQSPPRVQPDSSSSEPTASLKTEVKSEAWRCKACEKSFPMAPTLTSHFADHVACFEPGCQYSAVKRLVTEHMTIARSVERKKCNEWDELSYAPPLVYVCKICGAGGHWIYECPKIADPSAHVSPVAQSPGDRVFQFTADQKKFGPPGAGYCCKICEVPGHWIHDCSKIAKATRAPSIKPLKLPPNYCCKACGILGHLIYNCPLKVKNYQILALEEKPKLEGTTAQQQWRCEICEIEVALESQLVQHIGQHRSCPEPGCCFSAVRRALTTHLETTHGKVVKLSQPVAAKPKSPAISPYWRPGVSATDVRIASQSTLHLKHHMTCSKPGCSFTATKCVM